MKRYIHKMALSHGEENLILSLGGESKALSSFQMLREVLIFTGRM